CCDASVTAARVRVHEAFPGDGHGATSVSIGVEDLGFAVRIDFDDLALIVLREQDPSVRHADDAVTVVAALLPDELPFRATLDDAGNFGGRLSDNWPCLRGCSSATARAGTTFTTCTTGFSRASTGAAAAPGRRILARGDQRLITRIARGLQRRQRRIGRRRGQSRRRGLGPS